MTATNRCSRPEVFCKRDVLRNFAKCIGKHLCQSLFFNKDAGLKAWERNRLKSAYHILSFPEYPRETLLLKHFGKIIKCKISEENASSVIQRDICKCNKKSPSYVFRLELYIVFKLYAWKNTVVIYRILLNNFKTTLEIMSLEIKIQSLNSDTL